MEIVVGVLASFGGITGILILALKASSKIIIDRIEDRYKQKLNKELEKYKIILGNKTYISKTKFDTEFGIYRELSKSFCDMVKEISVLIPSGLTYTLANEEARKKAESEQYIKAMNSTVKAQDTLNSNIPFISEEIYKGYNNILSLCKTQLNVFAQRWNVLYMAPQYEKENLSLDDYNRTDNINKEFDKLNNLIRKYLSNLDVI